MDSFPFNPAKHHKTLIITALCERKTYWAELSLTCCNVVTTSAAFRAAHCWLFASHLRWFVWRGGKHPNRSSWTPEWFIPSKAASWSQANSQGIVFNEAYCQVSLSHHQNGMVCHDGFCQSVCGWTHSGNTIKKQQSKITTSHFVPLRLSQQSSY